MSSSHVAFYLSGLYALIVFLAALTAWLRGDDWETKLPRDIPALLTWTWVFFILGCIIEVS